MTLLTSELCLERPYEVRPGAEEHAADKIGGGYPGGSLDDLETAGGLDKTVAVVTFRVGGDVVAVDDVLAAVVRDKGEGGDVGCVGDGFCDPATGVCCGDAGQLLGLP